MGSQRIDLRPTSTLHQRVQAISPISVATAALLRAEGAQRDEVDACMAVLVKWEQEGRSAPRSMEEICTQAAEAIKFHRSRIIDQEESSDVDS